MWKPKSINQIIKTHLIHARSSCSSHSTQINEKLKKKRRKVSRQTNKHKQTSSVRALANDFPSKITNNRIHQDSNLTRNYFSIWENLKNIKVFTFAIAETRLQKHLEKFFFFRFNYFSFIQFFFAKLQIVALLDFN